MPWGRGPGVFREAERGRRPEGEGMLHRRRDVDGVVVVRTEQCVAMGIAFKPMMIDFVCQRRMTADQGFLHLTPGIKMETGGDGLGQQFNTPRHAIAVQGSDIVQVGRGIASAPDPLAAAKIYREAAWAAYLERLYKLNRFFYGFLLSLIQKKKSGGRSSNEVNQKFKKRKEWIGRLSRVG